MAVPHKKKMTAIKSTKKAPPKPAAKSSSKNKAASNVTLFKMARPAKITSPTPSNERIPPALQAMIDRQEISHVIATLARSLDRLDETLLRSTLHADATLDCGPGMFQGSGNDYAPWMFGVLHAAKSSHHMIGQSRCELEGDSANVESYFTIHLRLDKPTGREDVFLGGRYLDRMERRPAGTTGVWKIAHRKQILDWVRTEAVSDIFYHQNPDALWSARTKADPSHQISHFPGSQNNGKLPSFLGRRYESRSVKL